jgi:hypothetical protein
MSKLESTVSTIQQINKQFEAIGKRGDCQPDELQMHILGGIESLLAEIAMSLAIIADNMEENHDHT